MKKVIKLDKISPAEKKLRKKYKDVSFDELLGLAGFSELQYTPEFKKIARKKR